MTEVTDALVDAIDARQRDREMARLVQSWEPPPLRPGTWQYDAQQRQESKRLERVAAAEAEEDRQLQARERAAERKRQQREANAPARAKAEAELAELEAELARVEALRDELADRQAELEMVASR
jgi:hypothetical protein